MPGEHAPDLRIGSLFEGPRPADAGLDAFDAAASEPSDDGDEKPRRGRPPGAKDRKPRRKKGGSAYAKERRERERAAGGAERPASEPELPPIDPELVAKLLGSLSAPLLDRAGVPPLDEKELKAGSEAWAPILDHYFPAVAARVGIWGAPIVWTLGVSLPRIELAIENRQEAARREAGTFRPDAEPTPAMVEHATGARGPVHGPVVSDGEIAARRGAPRKRAAGGEEASS